MKIFKELRTLDWTDYSLREKDIRGHGRKTKQETRGVVGRVERGKAGGIVVHVLARMRGLLRGSTSF
ncbi:MAG: hypothetical protein JSW15_00770 [Deltaproteobacteria bacterium]|nr:MAG: hypothetical protein JSW15_00770 [Deltaproteobacteria bacterium]